MPEGPMVPLYRAILDALWSLDVMVRQQRAAYGVHTGGAAPTSLVVASKNGATCAHPRSFESHDAKPLVLEDSAWETRAGVAALAV